MFHTFMTISIPNIAVERKNNIEGESKGVGGEVQGYHEKKKETKYYGSSNQQPTTNNQ